MMISLCEHFFFALVTSFFSVVVIFAAVVVVVVGVNAFSVDFFWNHSKCVLCCVHEEGNKRKFQANWMWEMFTGHSHSHLSWIVLVFWPQIPINCFCCSNKIQIRLGFEISVYECEQQLKRWKYLAFMQTVCTHSSTSVYSKCVSHTSLDSHVNESVCILVFSYASVHTHERHRWPIKWRKLRVHLKKKRKKIKTMATTKNISNSKIWIGSKILKRRILQRQSKVAVYNMLLHK